MYHTTPQRTYAISKLTVDIESIIHETACPRLSNMDIESRAFTSTTVYLRPEKIYSSSPGGQPDHRTAFLHT